MLNLKKLKDGLIIALKQETKESLDRFIESLREREALHELKSLIIKSLNWGGLTTEHIEASKPVHGIENIDRIKNFDQNTTIATKAILEQYSLPEKLPERINLDFLDKKKALINCEPFFCNIAL